MLTKLNRLRQIQLSTLNQLQGNKNSILHSQFATRGLFDKKDKAKSKNLEEEAQDDSVFAETESVKSKGQGRQRMNRYGQDLERARVLQNLSQFPEYDPNRALNLSSPTPQESAKIQEKIFKQRAETLSRLQMYEKSSEILDLIKQRLATADKQGDLQPYLESKLESTKQPYSEYLAKQLTASQSKNVFSKLAASTEKTKLDPDAKNAALIQDQSIRDAGFQEAVQRLKEERFVADTQSLGGQKHRYTPANREDAKNYQILRQAQNHTEYVEYMEKFKKENVSEAVEKEFMDIERKMRILELRDKRQGKETPAKDSEEYMARLKRVINGEGRDRRLEDMLFDPKTNYKMTMQQKWETNRINDHQFICPPELMETAKTQRELLGEKVADGLFLQEDFVRQFMERNYNPEPDSKLSYDKVTLDAPKDFEREVFAKMSRETVYDDQASVNLGQGIPQSHTTGFTKQDFQQQRPHHRVMNAGELRSLQELPEYKVEDYDRMLAEQEALQDHHQDQFENAKIMEYENGLLRQKIAKKVQQLRKDFAKLKDKRQQVLKDVQESHFSQVEQQILPESKLFDVIEHEQDLNSKAGKDAIKKEIAFLTKLSEETYKFDPTSTDVEQYELQLKLLSLQGLLLDNSKLPAHLKQFDYILTQLDSNNIDHTPTIKARIFEYCVLSDQLSLANDQLQKLARDYTLALSPIDSRYLQKFFSNSVSDDNIDGAAHLVNYAIRYDIDLGGYPIQKFRGALDYYLNKNFDMNKILTFVKFYQRHYSDRLDKQAELQDDKELTDKQLEELSKRVFGPSEDLVDMAALAEYLVSSLGARQVIDPLTKDDSIWSLIDFFTASKQLIGICTQTQNNRITGKTIAEYLGNQFDNNQGFERLMTVALRIDGTDLGAEFYPQIMQRLREYTQKNNLPKSFSNRAIKDLYLKIRSSEASLGPAATELLLFVLNQADMDLEVIDFCEYQKIKGMTSDVLRFYLTESLLKLDIQQGSFQETLENSEVFSGSDDLSPCQITQTTKAIFLDKGTKKALEFFKDKLKQREQNSIARKNLFVSLYDQLAIGSQDELSLEQFKEKYLASQSLAKRLLKETYLANKMRRLLFEKDFEDIDRIFKLYTVMKQERDIGGEQYMLDESSLATTSLSKKMTKEQQEELVTIRDRKIKLLRDVTREDRKNLLEISKAMADEKFEIVDKFTIPVIDKLSGMFKEMTEEELDAVLTENLEGGDDQVVQQEGKEKVFRDFKEEKAFCERLIKENMEGYKDDQWYRKFDGDRIGGLVKRQQLNSRRKLEDYFEADLDREALEEYKQSIFQGADPSKDFSDPNVMAYYAHDVPLLEMREQLLEAVTEKKAEMLPIAVNIFNKVQDTKVKSLRLSDFRSTKDDNSSDISAALDKLELLLNDGRSPVLSAIKQTGRYSTEPLPDTLREYELSVKGGLKENPIDAGSYKRDNRRLKGLHAELSQIQTEITGIQEKLDQDTILKGADTSDKGLKKQKAKVSGDIKKQIDRRVQEMYEQYKKATQDGSKPEVSDEVKVSLMRDTFSVILGEQLVNTEQSKAASTFPTFYALDMVRFGLKKNIPGAIRLGELLLAEHCSGDPKSSMPVELQRAVKEYLIDHSQQYRDTIKQTGPINNTTIYHQATHSGAQRSSVICKDDPYWQEFFAKNYKKEDNWRYPSYLAWDHKKYGILGEVIDMEALEKRNKANEKLWAEQDI